MESDGAHDWDANPAVPRLSDPDAGSASGTSGYFYQSHVEERMAEAQNRCLILANKIRSSDYINVLLSGNPNPALDAELSTTADLMNGRIVLVDDSFKILKDTFGLSRGKTLVVSDVLKAFDGETSSYLNQKKKYF